MVESLSKSVDEAWLPGKQMIVKAPESEMVTAREVALLHLYGFGNLTVSHFHGFAGRLEQGLFVTDSCRDMAAFGQVRGTHTNGRRHRRSGQMPLMPERRSREVREAKHIRSTH
jgi:hypothetical protein